ncbi:Acyl-coenzyme A thioesterase 9 [Fusarium oxysporum f. sp. albedinis]|nr:Acyl-coenzyme A thioesterase 9 [Fusarium oxysporum f. sp. albedinis]
MEASWCDATVFNWLRELRWNATKTEKLIMTPGILGRIGIGSRLDTFLTPHGPSRHGSIMYSVPVHKETVMMSNVRKRAT